MFAIFMSITTQALAPNPCILIERHFGEPTLYTREGRNVFAVRRIVVAVWPDGRIVWSRPALKKTDRKDLRFFETNIPAPRVQAALRRFEKAGAFRIKRFTWLHTDVGYTNISIQTKGKSVSWGHSTSPKLGEGPYQSQSEWDRAVPAWNLVMKEAKALIPSKGKSIPPPRGERPRYTQPDKSLAKG
jgi:hypothetical protein